MVGERIILPSIMLRDPDRDIFLDDMTLTEFLGERIGAGRSGSRAYPVSGGRRYAELIGEQRCGTNLWS